MSVESKLTSLFRRVRRLQSLLRTEVLEGLIDDVLVISDQFSYLSFVPALQLIEETVLSFYFEISIIGTMLSEILIGGRTLHASIFIYGPTLAALQYLTASFKFIESINIVESPFMYAILPIWDWSVNVKFSSVISMLVQFTFDRYLNGVLMFKEAMPILESPVYYAYLPVFSELEILYRTLIGFSETLAVIQDIHTFIWFSDILSISEQEMYSLFLERNMEIVATLSSTSLGMILLMDTLSLGREIVGSVFLSDIVAIPDSFTKFNAIMERDMDHLIQLYVYASTLLSLSLDLDSVITAKPKLDEIASVIDDVTYLSTIAMVESSSLLQLFYYISGATIDQLSMVGELIAALNISSIISLQEAPMLYHSIYTGGSISFTDCALWVPFNEGSGNIFYDFSTKNNHGSLGNGATYTDGMFSSAYSGDGTNDYGKSLHSTSLNVTDTVSMCGWICQTGNATSTYQRITDKGGATTCWVQDESSSPSGQFVIRLTATPGGADQQVQFYTDLEQDVPYFFAWKYDKDAAQRLTLYINGVEFTGTCVQGRNYYSGTMSTNTSDMIIGNRSTYDRAWYGWIDELMMFYSPLTDAQVMELYRTGPPIAFLVRLLCTFADQLTDPLSLGTQIVGGILLSDTTDIVGLVDSFDELGVFVEGDLEYFVQLYTYTSKLLSLSLGVDSVIMAKIETDEIISIFDGMRLGTTTIIDSTTILQLIAYIGIDILDQLSMLNILMSKFNISDTISLQEVPTFYGNVYAPLAFLVELLFGFASYLVDSITGGGKMAYGLWSIFQTFKFGERKFTMTTWDVDID